MLKTIKAPSEEIWLKNRKKNINSTESSALFGMSPYQTTFELYHVKCGNLDDGFVANERTEAGQYMESAIAKYALDKMQLEGEPFKDYYYDDEDRMGSSFDWIITSPGQYNDWLIEVKNVDFIQYRDKWTEFEAPEHIECQVQHEMEVSNKPGCIIVALVGGNDLKFIYRERDKDMGQGLRQAVRAFWDGVASGMEPAPNYDSDADTIIRLHQAAGHEVLDGRGSVMINALINEYDKIRLMAKEIEDAKKVKKAEILDAIGDDYLKVIAADGFTLSCGMTKENEGQIITQDMVGKKIGGRKSYRSFRITQKKQEVTH